MISSSVCWCNRSWFVGIVCDYFGCVISCFSFFCFFGFLLCFSVCISCLFCCCFVIVYFFFGGWWCFSFVCSFFCGIWMYVILIL